MKKIYYNILIGIALLGVVDFFLEHPTFGNLEILFPKSFETILVYSRYSEVDELNEDDHIQIYSLILSEYNSYCLRDSLLNFAGLTNYEKRNFMPIPEGIKKKMKQLLGARSSEKLFFSNLDEVIDDRSIINTEYMAAITLSPIKKIDGKYYVGYDAWVNPLGSHGIVIEVGKKDSGWYVLNEVRHWVS